MYLRADVKAPAGSPLLKVVEDNLTDAHRRQFEPEPDYPNYVPSAYVSGWDFSRQGKPDDGLFTLMAQEIGFTPTEESPSFHVKKDGEGGYIVQPTVFYWRKANAIHHWFVEKVQNGVDECQESLVHPEMLLDLIDRCEQVAADRSKCHDLLPTVGGFFFGSTEYDEWYFRDVEETATGLKEAVAAIAPKCSTFTYQSSW